MKAKVATIARTPADCGETRRESGGPLDAQVEPVDLAALCRSAALLAHDEAVRRQVEVPGSGPRQQVSLEGGESPAWNPTGRELFFLSLPDSEGKRQMMAVDLLPGRTLNVGRPRPLFAFSEPPLRLRCEPGRCYAVALDGQQFYAVRATPIAATTPLTHIDLIQNWTEELKARVPAGPAR